jgi:hypothetical protein
MAITANTNKTCMIPPAEKTKKPSIHPMISRTAIRYNKLLIKIVLITVSKTIAIPKICRYYKKNLYRNNRKIIRVAAERMFFFKKI